MACRILSTGTEQYRMALILAIPYGLVVRIPAFHAGGPGSIPGVGANCFIHPHWVSVWLPQNQVPAGLEPAASRVWSERDNHYTTEPLHATLTGAYAEKKCGGNYGMVWQPHRYLVCQMDC